MAEAKLQFEILATAKLDELVRLQQQLLASTQRSVQLREAQTSLNNTFRNVAGMTLAFQAFTSLQQVIISLPSAMMQTVQAGVQFNATLESSRLGIASVLVQFDKTGQFANFNDALKASSEAIEVLKKKAVESPASFQSLVQGFQAVAGASASAGLTTNQTIDIVLNASQAIAALGLPTQQLTQEIRALMLGEIDMNAQLAKTLGITKAQVDTQKAQGTLYQFLTEKLKAFAEAGKLAGQTFTGAASNLGDAWQQLTAKVTFEVFESLRLTMLRLTDIIKDPQFAAAFDRSMQIIIEAVQKASAVFLFLMEHTEELILMTKLLLLAFAGYAGLKLPLLFVAIASAIGRTTIALQVQQIAAIATGRASVIALGQVAAGARTTTGLMAALTFSINSARTAILALWASTGIGLVVAALVMAATWAFDFFTNMKAAERAAANVRKETEQLTDSLRKQVTELKSQEEATQFVEENTAKILDLEERRKEAADAVKKELDAQKAILQQQIAAAQALTNAELERRRLAALRMEQLTKEAAAAQKVIEAYANRETNAVKVAQAKAKIEAADESSVRENLAATKATLAVEQARVDAETKRLNLLIAAKEQEEATAPLPGGKEELVALKQSRKEVINDEPLQKALIAYGEAIRFEDTLNKKKVDNLNRALEAIKREGDAVEEHLQLRTINETQAHDLRMANLEKQKAAELAIIDEQIEQAKNIEVPANNDPEKTNDALNAAAAKRIELENQRVKINQAAEDRIRAEANKTALAQIKLDEEAKRNQEQADDAAFVRREANAAKANELQAENIIAEKKNQLRETLPPEQADRAIEDLEKLRELNQAINAEELQDNPEAINALIQKYELEKKITEAKRQQSDIIRAIAAQREVEDSQSALEQSRTANALSEVDNNPALSRSQRLRARVPLLQEQRQQVLGRQKIGQARLEEDSTKGLITSAEIKQRTIELEQYSVKLREIDAQLANSTPSAQFMAPIRQAYQDSIIDAQKLGEVMVQVANSISQNMSNAFTSIIDGTKSASEAFTEMAANIVNSIINMLIQMAVQAAVMAVANFAINSLFAEAATAVWTPAAVAASIASYGAAAGVGQAAALTAINTSSAGFAEGGYTGNGGKDEPAGIVHRGEFVFTKAQTAELGTRYLGNLATQAERGYATGGLVDSPSAMMPPETSSPRRSTSASPVIHNEVVVMDYSRQKMNRYTESRSGRDAQSRNQQRLSV